MGIFMDQVLMLRKAHSRFNPPPHLDICCTIPYFILEYYNTADQDFISKVNQLHDAQHESGMKACTHLLILHNVVSRGGRNAQIFN